MTPSNGPTPYRDDLLCGRLIESLECLLGSAQDIHDGDKINRLLRELNDFRKPSNASLHESSFQADFNLAEINSLVDEISEAAEGFLKWAKNIREAQDAMKSRMELRRAVFDNVGGGQLRFG